MPCRMMRRFRRQVERREHLDHRIDFDRTRRKQALRHCMAISASFELTVNLASQQSTDASAVKNLPYINTAGQSKRSKMSTATAFTIKSNSMMDSQIGFISKWPALSICLGVTSFALYLVMLAAAAGWPGSVTSNCYEDYLITADCYCEKLRGDKPGDVWFAQPMNTISNLWFVLSGLLIAYSADSRAFPSKDWWETKMNPITQDRLYSTMYGLATCLLGVGSTCLHASFTTWGRQADMIAMYLIAAFTLLYPLVKNKALNKNQAVASYLALSAALVHWTVSIGTPEQTRRLFTSMIVLSWAVEIFNVDEESARHNKLARKILLSNVALFLAAVITWKSSESAGPFCYPDSLWQGHSLWHLQSAVAIAGQYFYYVAEDLVERKNLFIFETAPYAESVADSSSESGSVSS